MLDLRKPISSYVPFSNLTMTYYLSHHFTTYGLDWHICHDDHLHAPLVRGVCQLDAYFIMCSNNVNMHSHISTSKETLFLTLLLAHGCVSLWDAVAAGFESPDHSEDTPIRLSITAGLTSDLSFTGAER